MPQRKKVVTVLLPAVSSSMRDVVRGIADYAAEAGRWHLVLHLWGQLSEAGRHWIEQGDGLIFEKPVATSPVQPVEWHIPTIAVQQLELATRYPLVNTNYHEVGHRAAAYFMGKGLPHLAYLSYRDGDKAEAGLREAANKAGRSLSTYYLGAAQPEVDLTARRSVVGWLSRLPPPVGVLVRDDFLAQKIMDWMPSEWVPERIAILGVGNDSIVCELTRPTLSSIDRNAWDIGRTAASLLDRCMRGKSIPKEQHLLPPGSVIERQSTGLRYTSNPLVTRAVRMIEANLASAPPIDDLCASLCVSRSTLENHFRETLGHSIWQQRQYLQIERAKYLLTTTSDAMSSVAEQCGFANQQRLAESFRKNVGIPPSRYRVSANSA
jgi:LacI family transcriptional regulator